MKDLIHSNFNQLRSLISAQDQTFATKLEVSRLTQLMELNIRDVKEMLNPFTTKSQLVALREECVSIFSTKTACKSDKELLDNTIFSVRRDDVVR